MFSSKSKNNYKPIVSVKEQPVTNQRFQATTDANQNLQHAVGTTAGCSSVKPDTPKRLSYFSAIHLTKIFKSPSQFVHTTFGGQTPSTAATLLTSTPAPQLHALKKNATDDSKRMLDESAQPVQRCNSSATNANATVYNQLSKSPRRQIDVLPVLSNRNCTLLPMNSNHSVGRNDDDDQLNSNVPSAIADCTDRVLQCAHPSTNNTNHNQINGCQTRPISTATSNAHADTLCTAELANIIEETLMPAHQSEMSDVSSVLAIQAASTSRNPFLLHSFEDVNGQPELTIGRANYFEQSLRSWCRSNDADQSGDVRSNVQRPIFPPADIQTVLQPLGKKFVKQVICVCER